MKKILPAIMFVAGIAGGATGGEYWPSLTDSELIYDTGINVAIEAYWQPGYFQYREYSNSYFVSNVFSEGEDGDIYVHGGDSYYEGGFDVDMWGTYAPVKFLDLPLYVGKSWAIDYFEDLGWRTWSCSVEGSVIESGVLETNLGELEYFIVSIQGISGYVDGVYYLNQVYGPIVLPNGASIVGATGTVPTASQSWGSVKLLYR